MDIQSLTHRDYSLKDSPSSNLSFLFLINSTKAPHLALKVYCYPLLPMHSAIWCSLSFPTTWTWPHKVQWQEFWERGYHLLLMDLRSR